MRDILFQSDALSVPRSRLIEVEYSIRITASAGALTPDVHVTLPLRIINFLSVDPTPSDPLLSSDGSYARLVPFGHSPSSGTPTSQSDTNGAIQYTFSEVSTISIDPLSTPPDMSPLSDYYPSPSAQATPRSPGLFNSIPGNVLVLEPRPTPVDHAPNTINASRTSPDGTAVPRTSESGPSMYSTDSLTPSSPITPATFDPSYMRTPSAALGNLDLHDGADSDEKIASIIDAAQGGPLSASAHSDTTDFYARRSHGHERTKNNGSPQTISGRTPPAQFTQSPQRRPPVATFATSSPMIVRIGTPVYRNPSPISLEEPRSSLVSPRGSQVIHERAYREESTTPTLRPPTTSRNNISALKLTPNAPHLGSPRRRPPSCRLPQPPLQHQPTSDGSRSGIAQGCIPMSRTHLVATSSVVTPGNDGLLTSCPRTPHEQPGTVPASKSDATLSSKPQGLGRSDSSIVRGRIAAYEQRLRSSVDSSEG